MRVPFALLLLLAPLATTGCLEFVGSEEPEDGEETPAPHATEIAMHNGVFAPDAATVAKGETLRFSAHDGKHTVESTNGVYDAGELVAGEHEDVLMNVAGSFVFQCRYHSGMRLALTVTE